MDMMKMTDRTYYAPKGGLPPQTDLITDRAVFMKGGSLLPICECS